MTVNKDVNLGTVFTIAAFFVVQGAGVIWWGSSTTGKIEALTASVQAFSADLQKEVDDRIDDRRRIYDRIVANDRIIAELVANERATDAILTAINEDLGYLRNEIAQNNELIRTSLIEAAANRRRPND